MGEEIRFDYYYGAEAEQFSFYRVPRLLIKDRRFRNLSSDAKLLYGLMLDRMSLSMRNGWFDEENRAYIVYTIDDVQEDLGCAREKAVKVMAELDASKGIGLIEKKRRGLGKPDIIYVKNFVIKDSPDDVKCDTVSGLQERDDSSLDEVQDTGAEQADESEMSAPRAGNPHDSTEVRKSNFKKSENRTSGSLKNRLQEIRKSNFSKFEKQTSGSSETEPLQVRNPNSNYTDYSYTDSNQTEGNQINLIYPENGGADSREIISSGREDAIDADDRNDVINETTEYMNLIRENIAYDCWMASKDRSVREQVDGIYNIICEIVCVKRDTVRIGRTDYPYSLVKSQFLKINSDHVEYVLECMKKTTTAITDIKAYLITALYNAVNSIDFYYQQAVNHDMAHGL